MANFDDENNPQALREHIKKFYKMFDFEPAKAKDYEQDIAELFKDNHAAFVFRGFAKLPRGMTRLDSG